VKRLRIAAVVTEVRRYSHAQHILDRFLFGYSWDGRHHVPDIELVSLYTDQRPDGELSRDRAYFKEQLNRLKEDHPIIGDVAGIGLMLGVGLVKDQETGEKFGDEVNLGERLKDKFRQEGLILQAGNGTITFSPPLCITRDEVDEIVAGVDRSLGEIEREF